jgi:hypothetical protein
MRAPTRKQNADMNFVPLPEHSGPPNDEAIERRELGFLRPGLWSAMAVFVLINLPFWCLQTSFVLSRPLVSFDLILVALIATRSLSLGASALLLAWAVEGVLQASQGYHFRAVGEFVGAFRFAGAVGWQQFVTPLSVGVVVLFAACAGLALALVRRRRPSKRALLLLAFMAFAFDLVNGSTQSFGLGKDQRLIGLNMAGSPTWNIVVGKVREARNRSLPMTRIEAPMSFAAVDGWHASHPDRSVLLLVVESMGMPIAQPVRDWMTRRIASADIRHRWDVAVGAEPFSGSTTYGELRVLCRLAGHYSRLTPADARQCLPAAYARDGYRTTGLHGFSKRMFDRAEWWPTVGFQESLFLEQLGSHGDECGSAFPGLCDKALITRAVGIADKPRQFVYALTLNTHLPLEPMPVPEDLQRLCQSASVADSACQLVSQLGQVLDVIGTTLQQTKSAPMVVVVGDHAPPFLSTVDRQAFESRRVPAIVLTPLE